MTDAMVYRVVMGWQEMASLFPGAKCGSCGHVELDGVDHAAAREAGWVSVPGSAFSRWEKRFATKEAATTAHLGRTP